MTGEEEGQTEEKVSEWSTISMPKAILARVDAIFGRLGYVSKSEYIRAATLKQLRQDEGADE